MLCNTQKREQYLGTQDWIGVDEATGTMIHIHLHLYMIAGHSGIMEYILPWNEKVFYTRQINSENGIYQMNPSLEIILLFTRLGIEHSPKKLKKTPDGWVLKEKTKKEISYLKERMNDTISHEMAKELYHICYDSLTKFIEKSDLNTDDLKQIKKLMKNACSKWLRYGRYKTLFLKNKNKFTSFIRNKLLKGSFKGIYRKIPASGRGLTVAFVGKDGTGRTMLAKDVLKWLNWKLDANYIYVGDYEIIPPDRHIRNTFTRMQKAV